MLLDVPSRDGHNNSKKGSCIVPLSVSNRPPEAKTGIGLSCPLFRSTWWVCVANSTALSTPSIGGGTSLDQATFTKTLRPCETGMGFVDSWVGVALKIPDCSSLDLIQNPGEGETLIWTEVMTG